MKFKDRYVHRLCVFALAAVFALAGCGGGGGGTTATEEEMPMPTPQETCEGAGGRWNADMTCTSAEALQRAAVAMAIEAAEMAVAAVDDASTDAEVTAANDAIAAANAAIASATGIPMEERDANTETVGVLTARLSAAETARTAHMEDEQKAADAAMMETARELHAGIQEFNNSASDASYTSSAGNSITVSLSDLITTAALTEDKDATVAALHGWEGRRWTASPEGGGAYEAVSYSNVGEPTPGDPFNEEYSPDGTTGELAIDTSTAAVQARVAGSSFDQRAGIKTFELPDNRVRVVLSGSYHGVSGNYYCTPTGGGTDCSATLAADGFTLGGGTWTFKPADPEARVTSAPDTVYASYGRWMHKSEDGSINEAGGWRHNRGAVPAASGLTALQGTATYSGGATGFYALHSPTGGTNDAGAFTADATLSVDFSGNTATGAIDNFTGADGQPRNWSVELTEFAVSDTGGISAGVPPQTKWTIDGTASEAGGSWTGTLYDNDAGGVPKVATGRFDSLYGNEGKMAGAFGVTRR